MYELLLIVVIFIILVLLGAGLYYGLYTNIIAQDAIADEIMRTDILKQTSSDNAALKNEVMKTIDSNKAYLDAKIGKLPSSNLTIQDQINQVNFVKDLIKAQPNDKVFKYVMDVGDNTKQLKLASNVTASMGLTVNTDVANQFKICDTTSNCVRFGMDNGTLKITPDTNNIQLGDNILLNNQQKKVYIKDLYIYDGADISKASVDTTATKITNSQVSTVYVIGLKGYYDLNKQDQLSIKDVTKNNLMVIPLEVVRNMQGLPNTHQITDENTLIVNNKQYIVYPLSKIYVPVPSTDVTGYNSRDMSIASQTIDNITFGIRLVSTAITPPTPTTAPTTTPATAPTTTPTTAPTTTT